MAALDVTEWLRTLGLERYDEAFRTNDIDGEVLADLDDADLEKLGVSLGHRKKLLKAIAALGTGTTPSAKAGAAEPEAQGERRQVTVLFADLVGYTRLTHELGAEAMHAIADRFFALADGVIERFGGTIDKHIGDCAMAVFGAPVAHGNDPERAVRAALAICDAMPDLSRELGRELDVHVGIASGQVVASRGAGHKTYSITGDSVNLASRLTDQAGASVILISDAVRHMLPPRFVCDEADTVAVKGLAELVRAWRLIGVGEAVREDRPLVGRRAELAQFKGALGACREADRGQTVVIRGEAGIGKTRLVEEFQAQGEAEGFACHLSLVLDFGVGTGQDVIRALVRRLLALTMSSNPATVEAVADQAEVDGLIAHDQRVYLNDLLDLPQPITLRALYDAMDNPTRNRGKCEVVGTLVRIISQRQPLLLMVEDVHWADRLTLEHLAALAATVAECPALLVITSRVDGDPLGQAWRAGTGGSPLMTIDLGPLRRQEAAALAGAYLDASAEFAKRCVERAAGNPLFLVQLLQHAEESAGAGVPGSVQSLVQARMDQLDPFDREALQAAAIFGQRFALDSLRHTIKSPDYSCAALVEHLLVRPAGDELLFTHALIRDAVYDTLLMARRRDLHRCAAEWFAGRDLGLRAEHLDRAEDATAPQAYLETARAQAESYHYERARALAERGLILATEAADRFGLTCLRGDVLHDLGDMAEAGAAYDAALEAASDDAQRCRAWLGLAAVKRVIDDLDGAFADLDRAEAVASRLGLDGELARVHFLRGNLFFPRGNLQGVLDEHRKSLRLAKVSSSVELEAAALGGLGDAEYARGRMLTAAERFDACISLCHEHGFGRIEVANLPMAAFTRIYALKLADAASGAQAAIEASTRVGHKRSLIVARHAACFRALVAGEHNAAEDHAMQALETARQLGARRFESEALHFLGAVRHAQDRRAEGVHVLTEALEISRETGMAFMGPWLLADLALATDDPDERQAALAEGERLLASGSLSHNHLWFYPAAIETSLECEEWSEAERYADALEAYTRAEPLPWSEFYIARGRALAAYGAGHRDHAMMEQLARLRAEAARTGFMSPLAAIEDALWAP